MQFDLNTFFHAFYVAFAFGVMLFGALAYRRVLDVVSLKRSELGEDRDAYISAPGIVMMVGMMVVTVVAAYFCFTRSEPAIYTYALPMILGLQVIQLTMRLYYQRTVFKTRGIIVKSALFENRKTIYYHTIVDAVVNRTWLWVTFNLTTEGGDAVTFRIFRFSAPSAYRILRSWCPVPIRLLPTSRT